MGSLCKNGDSAKMGPLCKNSGHIFILGIHAIILFLNIPEPVCNDFAFIRS